MAIAKEKEHGIMQAERKELSKLFTNKNLTEKVALRTWMGESDDPLRFQLARFTCALGSQLPWSFSIDGVSSEDQRNHCIPNP